MDSNLARKFVKKNAGHIRCEPSGKTYKELTQEYSLLMDLLKSKQRLVLNMVRKKGKNDFVTRGEMEFIWNQVSFGLKKLNDRQAALNAHHQQLVRNPEFFRRGCAM